MCHYDKMQLSANKGWKPLRTLYLGRDVEVKEELLISTSLYQGAMNTTVKYFLIAQLGSVL
jgi:hypothetical protein